MANLRIAYVSRSAVPRSGGIEAHLDRVAHGLLDHGHAVRVWAARIDDKPFTRTNTTLSAQRFAPFTRDGLETRQIPVGVAGLVTMGPVAIGRVPGVDRLGYDRIRRMTLPLVVGSIAPGFKREFGDAGIAHSWGGEPLMHAALRAARDKKMGFVVTPFAHPGHWGDDALNWDLYRAADAVVALLPREGDFYESLGVPRHKLHVIPVGAPPEVPGGSVPKTETLVLCLGVKRRYKYSALLEAIPKIKNPDVRFAFVGPETPESEDDFSKTSDPRIVVRGKVDETEKWGWLRAADVLCLPSVSEILPVSILEAWRTGTAVVVAHGRFTRDLVADGEDGIVCEGDADSVAKAVEEALADPARLEAMGRAGAAKVKAHYEPETVVAQHEALYRSLA